MIREGMIASVFDYKVKNAVPQTIYKQDNVVVNAVEMSC